MLTSQRRKVIAELVHTEGQVIVHDLSRRWGISEDAIRRDLRELAAEGLLQRVHGGAIASSPALGDYAKRQELSPEAKKTLGASAAALVAEGQVVGIDGGTTNLQLVKSLPRSLKATVVTHSPTIASELRHHELVDVVLIGGKLFRHSMVTLGATVFDALDHIQLDIFFLGATGIHPEAGVTTGDYEEAAVKRAFCKRSAEVVLLASPEKLNAASAYKIVPASDIDVLVVDTVTAESITRSFEEAGITIVRADDKGKDGCTKQTRLSTQAPG